MCRTLAHLQEGQDIPQGAICLIRHYPEKENGSFLLYLRAERDFPFADSKKEGEKGMLECSVVDMEGDPETIRKGAKFVIPYKRFIEGSWDDSGY